MRRRITLTSEPMVHTPGMLKWGMNAYKSPKDREVVKAVFSDGYGLPDDVAHGLLTGEIAHTVEGENVIFEADVPEDWTP